MKLSLRSLSVLLMAVLGCLLALGLGGVRPGGAASAVLAQTLPEQSGSFVGTVAGTDAFVGIVRSGDHVEAYVCDGTQAGVTTWGWFAGELVGGQAVLASTNGLALTLDLSGAVPAGQLQIRDGAQFSFTTDAATGPGAGLWRGQGLVNGDPVLAGWVVLNIGDQRGAVVRHGTTGPVGFVNPNVGLNTQPVDVGGASIIAILIG